jgi:hypothetical protein
MLYWTLGIIVLIIKLGIVLWASLPWRWLVYGKGDFWDGFKSVSAVRVGIKLLQPVADI